MTLLSFNPGLRDVGCALWRGKELRGAALVRGPADSQGPEQWRGMAHAVRDWAGDADAVAFEMMSPRRTDLPYRSAQIYELVAVSAWICALFPAATCTGYTPQQWEGGLKRDKRGRGPDPVLERVRGRLSPGELARVLEAPAQAKRHIVWDAAGVGMHHLGRLGRRKVYPR